MCWRYTLNKEEQSKFIYESKHSLAINEYEYIFKTRPIRTNTIEIVGGGEPLLYKNFSSLATKVKKNHLFGLLVTNGVYLTRNMADHLLKIEWDTIRISFHAGNEDTYEAVNGKNDFNLVCKNINYLIRKKNNNKRWEKKTFVGLMFVIQKLNINDILTFSHLAERLQCNYIEFTRYSPTNKNLQLNKNEYNEVLKKLAIVESTCSIQNNATDIIRQYKNNEISFKKMKTVQSNTISNKIFQCDVLNDSLVITETGSIIPCCYFYYKPQANIRKDRNVWKIWRQSKYKKLRSKINLGNYPDECLKYCSFPNHT
jgi:MoaA/NifB/PqqE/SkfB family radical SAM enzyme